MYVYKLIYEKQNKGIGSMNIGYYSSYKKARKVKKKYQAIVPGFKDHSHGFKIKKIEVLSENKAFSNASVIGNVNKIVEDLKHVFYMCVAIEKKQYDDKIFSEDLQNLYETIYYYKSAFDSGCNNSYYESKVHRALMCYDRKLEILEKSIMKDFEEIADKLEFDY